MNTAQKLLFRIAGPAVLGVMAVPAFAVGEFDVTGLVDTLGLVLSAVSLIGVTVLTIYAAMAGYKIIRRAL